MKHINPAQLKLNEIRQIMREYYYNLDMRIYGGIAGVVALTDIEHVLGMDWTRGEELERRKKAEGAADE